MALRPFAKSHVTIFFVENHWQLQYPQEFFWNQSTLIIYRAIFEERDFTSVNIWFFFSIAIVILVPIYFPIISRKQPGISWEFAR